MSKINPLFSEISTQIHTMYEKVAIITQMWHLAKCYFASLSISWYLITVPKMNKIATFFSKISEQTLKIYEKIAIIIQIWHRTKSILHASTAHGTWSWYPVWRKSTQPSWRNAWGWTDWQTESFLICPNSVYAEQRIIKSMVKWSKWN